MSQPQTSAPESITIPTGALHLILARCRRALPPTIPWSESRERMESAAHKACRDTLKDIEADLEALLDPLADHRPSA